MASPVFLSGLGLLYLIYKSFTAAVRTLGANLSYHNELTSTLRIVSRSSKRSPQNQK